MAATAIHGGTMPLAALTTVFSPPCPTSWLLTGTRLPSQLPMFPRSGPASCDPPSWSRNLEGGGFQYYSPAICPRGFIVGPGCGLAKTRTAEGFPAVMPGETVAYCVPIGMSCTTDTTDFRGGVWGWTQAGTAAGAAVTVGPAMQIRWAEADLEVLETHPLTPGLRRQVVATGTGAAGPNATPVSPAGNGVNPTVTRTPNTQIPTAGEDPPIPSTTKSTSSQPAAASSSNPKASGGSSWPLDRNTTAFLIVILVILVGVIIGILGLITVRRHKAGKLKGFPERLVGWLIPRDRAASHGKGKLIDNDEIEGAHLENPEQPLPPELEYGPARGSTMNPAELDGWGVGQRPRRWTGIPQRPPRPRTPPNAGPSIVIHRLSAVRESLGEIAEDHAWKVAEPSPVHLQPAAGRPLTLSHRRPEPLSGGSVSPIASPPMPSPLSPPYEETTFRFGNEARAWTYWETPEMANARGVI